MTRRTNIREIEIEIDVFSGRNIRIIYFAASHGAHQVKEKGSERVNNEAPIFLG